MSMLAERRTKTKWTLNPRGKLWSEDSNKFGQKLLEKMGWTAGKGLGAKEQGITTHIHVQMKSDNTGVGFKGKDKDWCKHQASFDEILSTLNKSRSEESIPITSQSLEERSKASKARLHYHKFTRGKDVSKYSSKDLECILGVQNEISQASTDDGNIEDIGAKDDSFGVQTIVGGSINDYLYRKQRSKMKKWESVHGLENDCGGNRKRAEETENPEELGLNKGTEGKENKRKKKRKKLELEEERDVNSMNESIHLDELENMEGNASKDVVELERSGSKNCSEKKRENVSNLDCVDESAQVGVYEEIEKKNITGFVKQKSKKSGGVTQFQRKEDLSFVEPGCANMECEQYSNGNPIVEERDVGIIDGTQKKPKKRKSASGVKVGKCDESGLKTDNDIVLDDSSNSTSINKKQDVEDHVVHFDEKSSSKKEMRKVKRAKEKKTKMKSEWDHYLCINDKKCDKVVIDSSCKMFKGANLHMIKGYGSFIKTEDKFN